jgi:hypothetical protein
MPDQPRTLNPREEVQQSQRDILDLLTEPEASACLWTVDELVREMEDPCVSDSVDALYRAGLVHRTSDGFIFASRAAVRHTQLVGHVV